VKLYFLTLKDIQDTSADDGDGDPDGGDDNSVIDTISVKSVKTIANIGDDIAYNDIYIF